MVRGVSRRVIVVKPEQPALFEQAIFLVRDYNAPRGDMVREAHRHHLGADGARFVNRL